MTRLETGATGTPALRPLDFTRVELADRFWAPRQRANRERSIPAQYRACKETGRIDAFALTWQPGDEPKPHYFWDSDVAKWIEAASYTLAQHPDPDLDALLDQVIAKIAGAQQPDGYLNVYFTVVAPAKRWDNLGMWHELYCAGHLFEAAVAHHQATGKRILLDVACRYADYIASVFGPDGRAGTSGHPEIELALMRLSRATGNRRYAELCRFFLDQRGQKPSVFQRELARLAPDDAATNRHFFGEGDAFHSEYCQDHLPVREQSEVAGHAVRALYLYCGMVDAGAELGDAALIAAARRLWENLASKRMYVTGGLGPSQRNEGFTADYDLPNREAYAETCAAVAFAFFSHRLLQLEGDARYADALERVLYNGAISGMSLDGERFFYVNPLESAGDHHRQNWFNCACCPPNIARLVASIGGYMYSQSETEAYVHLYAAGRARFIFAGQQVDLTVATEYPWDGRIRLTVEAERPVRFGLRLRVPGWCRQATLRVEGEPVTVPNAHGYLVVARTWRPGELVELELDMPIRRVYAHPSVAQDAAQVALMRGPVVYCLEQGDNPGELHRLRLPRTAALEARYEPELLGGVTVVEGDAWCVTDDGWGARLYDDEPPAPKRVRFRAVPYYAWDHRAPGAMRVWLHEGAAQGAV